MAQLGSTTVSGDLTVTGENKKIETPDIVSTNGTITNLTVNTLKFKINNVDTDLATTLLDLLYPVGSIYIYRGRPTFIDGNPVCPLKAKIGGNWKQLKNYFLYAIENGTGGDNKTSDDPKGSNNAIIPSHTHTGTIKFNSNINTEGAGNHRHSLSIDENDGTSWSEADEGARHRLVVTGSKEKGSITTDDARSEISIKNTDPIYMDALGHHVHTINLKDYTGATITTNDPGESVDGKNMPRYIEVYAWEREA